MKVVSSGGRFGGEQISKFEYICVFVAWIPQFNGRMRCGLVGTDHMEDFNNKPVLKAELINYTGSLLFGKDFGMPTTYWFKNGLIHNDNGPAVVNHNFGESFAKNGSFIVENGKETGEKWALGVYNSFVDE